MWSSTGLIYYLMLYYSKYFKGNFFLNYSVMGLADAFTLFFLDIVMKYMSKVGALRFINKTIITFTVVLLLVMQFVTPSILVYLVPVILLILKL